MDNKRQASKPVIPDIETCPRCGNPILLGDTICNVCGYNIQSLKSRFREQPPNVVAVASFVVGVLVALAATGMGDPWRFITLFIAFGIIVGGGLYYAAHLLLLDDDRRQKPGK